MSEYFDRISKFNEKLSAFKDDRDAVRILMEKEKFPKWEYNDVTDTWLKSVKLYKGYAIDDSGNRNLVRLGLDDKVPDLWAYRDNPEDAHKSFEFDPSYFRGWLVDAESAGYITVFNNIEFECVEVPLDEPTEEDLQLLLLADRVEGLLCKKG